MRRQMGPLMLASRRGREGVRKKDLIKAMGMWIKR
jgi:hypothetical protein